MIPTFRFAPSPNGDLHLGHAYSALLNGDRARASGGRLLIRIEDIDPTRCRPEFEAAILDDLAWLGLDWEKPVRRQSEHFDAYTAALDRLQAMDLVYPSFMSRAEIKAATAAPDWPRDPDGAPLYPALDRDLDPGEAARRVAGGAPFAWRLKMDAAIGRAGPLEFTELGSGPDGETGTILADPSRWGDVVLARKETPTSYHLSVVVDDADQGVTHVVRGADLFHATGVHRLLQTLLGLPAPVYRHHGLILDPAGRKLSKSEGSTGLSALRAAGATPADIRRMVGLPEAGVP
ncbi:tRNA glutamyl-Q(34) synthetase GluQRS [Kaistia adipata]|uniref:tRNA glutamyl-Q(34) synthetase GluQRS n=1 Tax=Kaistia adipata TaxID=166954 RepID=UPI00041A464E|nr:tRNA glutamyl-Q(34) synthetase GluQRS [Kaistia adipata]